MSRKIQNNRSIFTHIEGQQRVVIDELYPEVNCGRFPIKRVIGEKVRVEANIYADGHEELGASLLYRHESESDWHSELLTPLENDRWYGTFSVEKMGWYFYTIKGWIDEFKTFRKNLKKKLDAKQDVQVDLHIGFQILERVYSRVDKTIQKKLQPYINILIQKEVQHETLNKIFDDELLQLMSKFAFPRFESKYAPALKVFVDRQRANFGAWYELFPRSWGKHGSHGTFKDLIANLSYIKNMGFDVLYLSPIHPIGTTNRKGKNNNIKANSTECGSPWAIGDSSGGHKAIHPQLGTMDDFCSFVKAVNDLDMEVALDIALQCSPDHPYLKEHPEWFRKRPDGTLQYAENPPKKYEDIYPFDFETNEWFSLWQEIKDVFLFWIEKGVRIFRVDNPHTKPFIFWEWLIDEIKKPHPDVIFLSEAFTRPNVMYHLAKLGFSQSYTYFTWRNNKYEIESYFVELVSSKISNFFRPNLWPNTPDILHEYLQKGGREGFMIRFILAATLGTNYGIYGPAFELCENKALREGSEEYLDSEKYEIKNWDLNSSNGIQDLITKVNQIRREQSALQNMHTLRFHYCDNPEIICYTKHSDDLSSIVMVVINLNFNHTQAGMVEMPIQQFDIYTDTFLVHDLLTDNKYIWKGNRNYVELNPKNFPAHIFIIKKENLSGKKL